MSRYNTNSSRKLFFLFLLLGALTARADGGRDSLRRAWTDSLYLQLYGGVNKSANENLPWSEFLTYPCSGGAFIGLGREFHPLWGWRAAFRFNRNKSRNVARCENDEPWGWNSLELFGDVTFDLSDCLRKRKVRTARPCFNLKAFAGLGAAYTFAFPKDVPLSYTVPYSKNSAVCFGFRGGLTATYALTSRWHLGAEFSQNFFVDKFNGVKDGTPFDSRSNLKLGITYFFLPRAKKPVRQVTEVVYDSRLRTIPAMPLWLPDDETEKVRQLAGRAFLDFPVNETVIYPAYRRNPEELERIARTIDSALFDRTMQVRSITLHGYASPESPYDNNVRLAKGRTAALKTYVQRKFNVSAEVFQTSYTPEDWQNLRNFIADGGRRRVKGDIWYENADVLETPAMPDFVAAHKSELLQIIDSSLHPDEKERRLKQVGEGKPYAWLLQHVFPGLRHTDYVIEYVVRQYPVKEARKLIYTHPEALSLREMYRVAQSYEEASDDWRDALLIAADRHPDDETANLNAAVVCVQVRRLQDARLYLQRAGDTSRSRYVRQVIDAMEGKVKWKLDKNNHLEITE